MAQKTNELYRDLMGVCGLNPWIQHDSSSRRQMFSSHIGQTLVINGSTERYCQTGMEREYAKYTFSTKMPVDGDIIKIIDRYKSKVGTGSIDLNPQTIVIYEDTATKEVGIINITNFCSYHQYFGFQYVPRPALEDVKVGASIAGGTILLDSPSVTPDGGYKYGRECNMAFMTHPSVSEDGIMISRDVLPAFGFKTYENRVVEWGSKFFPLNLYGDEENYKPFPDIGDRIRADGLLVCLRSYDKDLAVVEQSVKDLMEPDLIFDQATYAGGAGGRIVDIRIQHDRNNSRSGTPQGMEAQTDKYDNARRQFYQEILSEYNRLKKDRGDALRITHEFHSLIVEAMAVIGDEKEKIVKLYRRAPLDDWRIEFVVEYDIVPTIGFKLTDCHGGKGVICHIAEPHEMPVDENGNRADIVMDPNSTISRMNLGRLYEQYINAASRDAALKITRDLGVQKTDRHLVHTLRAIQKTNPQAIQTAWEYLMGYYRIVSPKMHLWFTDGEYQRDAIEHLASVINKGIFLYIPPDNEPESPNIIKELEKYYRPTYGPVTYIGNSGRKITTKNPVRIGSMYVIILEKTGDDWTAVDSGKVQHFGVLSQVTNNDKFSRPSRNQAIRALGESEVRIYAAYAGTKVTADLLDRNNNPATHKAVLHSILKAEQPTNIQSAVDRNEIPLGGSKPIMLVKHILECSGIKFIYNKHVPEMP